VSDWKVNLECEEGGSHKFWRARYEGTTLYVNFGRIGTNGQTQVKQFSSVADCEKEMASLERSKRKKGYEDAVAAGLAEAGAGLVGFSSPAATAAASRPGLTTDLSLRSPERKVDMRVTQDEAQVRIVAVEQYESAQVAAQAFARLEAAMKEEGYKPAKLPENF